MNAGMDVEVALCFSFRVDSSASRCRPQESGVHHPSRSQLWSIPVLVER